MWRTIHVVALGLPAAADEATKEAYVAFFEALRTVIPCATCASGYSAIVDRTEPSIRGAVEQGADALFSWSVVVHNRVAEKLGQPPMSEDFVRENYLFGDAPPAAPEPGPGPEPRRGGGASGRGEAASPWSEKTFRRHARNPVLVSAAAVSTVALVALVLWVSIRAGGRSRR